MASPGMLAIHGELVVIGYEPDGDSVRFVADDPGLFAQIQRGYKVRPSGRDGSVQLRFEAIDTPETHYGKDSQPLGGAARDSLLGWIGFADLAYGADGNKVTEARPRAVRAVALTKAADPHGRPISYVIAREDDLPEDGRWHVVGAAMLDKTLNARALAEGSAYPTFYTSTPVRHVSHLRTLAAKARANRLGVWAADHTAAFRLIDQSSIGPDGQLILPKLFRRATDYLKDVGAGKFTGNLADWLDANAHTPTRQEDDIVVLSSCGGVEVPLSVLVEQHNDTVAFRPDLLDIKFVEK
ncbi:MAG TPA: thermonuclease family protein [Streptosporangiaceae bacterium]